MALTKKKFRVLNPRGIPAEVNGERVRILAFKVGDTEVDAFEGDELVPPISTADAEGLVEKGFLEVI